MFESFVTKTGSVSPLGLTANETTESVISNKNRLAPIPAGTFPAEFPIKFIGLLPKQTLTGFSNEDGLIEENKQLWLKNLFFDFDFEKANVDYIIFSHNYGPSCYEYLQQKENDFYFNPRRALSNADFIKFFSGQSDKVKDVPYVDIHNTCASSLAAIALAKKYVEVGLAKSCLVIAYELSNNLRPLFLSLNVLGALNSTAVELDRASVPFSDDRGGFVKADAMGYTLIQTAEMAKLSQNAPISRIRGVAITSDCNSLTDGVEDGSMVESTILKCLTDSNVAAEDIGYINAHGSGTYLNDKIELSGIQKVFKNPSKTMFLSSNKSQFGHALCATGMVEVDVLTKMFQGNFIAPNLNYRTKQEKNNIFIPDKSILNQKIKFALKNSFGFGGYNACVIFENLL